jgi:hypothetical protein
VGWDAKILDALVRLTGPGYQRLVALVVSRTQPAAVPIPQAARQRAGGRAKTSA